MKKMLFAFVLFLGFADEAHAQRVVADVAIGTATVQNVSIGTATAQVDLVKIGERTSIEVCTSTTTTLSCGFGIGIATSTVNGIVGRPVINECKEWRIGNLIDLFCALGLGNGESQTVDLTITQTGNAK